MKKTAFLSEPRKHKALKFVLENAAIAGAVVYRIAIKINSNLIVMKLIHIIFLIN